MQRDARRRSTTTDCRNSWLAGQQYQGHIVLTAEPPESPATDGVRTLEVRWIFPGQLKSAVTAWFGCFPAAAESRQDSYLLDPQLRRLSVKVRGGEALEVKVYRGSPGILEVAGRSRGRVECWQKWPFPCSQLSQGSRDPAGWMLPGPMRSGSVSGQAPGSSAHAI